MSILSGVRNANGLVYLVVDQLSITQKVIGHDFLHQRRLRMQ